MVIGYQSAGARRAAFLGLATGIGFALTAVLVAGIGAAYTASGIGGVLTSPLTYLLVVFGPGFFFLLQKALQAGTLVASQPALTLSNPVVAMVFGVLVFGEQVRTGGWIALAFAAARARRRRHGGAGPLPAVERGRRGGLRRRPRGLRETLGLTVCSSRQTPGPSVPDLSQRGCPWRHAGSPVSMTRQSPARRTRWARPGNSPLGSRALLRVLTRIRHVLGSFWFIPATLCLGAGMLAEVLVTSADAQQRLALGPLSPVFYRVGVSGSREILGAIAGSMLTVASTTFSITIAVLALTSSTYGARLVRNFMTDRGNQVVLGVFVATFLYSLLVLRSIRTVEESGGTDVLDFVPHLAVNVGVLLAVVSVGFLVWFIHHISVSIQVWTLSARVRGELRSTVDRLYPEELGTEPEEVDRADPVGRPPGRGARVEAPRAGYVVAVRQDGLMQIARRHDVVVTLSVRPGRFCVEGTEIACVHPEDRAADEVLRDVAATINFDDVRSPEQDIEFATQQLVEMAVRALSPGTNDPYTAINALDCLSAGLCLLCRRRTPAAARYDEDGALRVVAPAVPPADLVDIVFDAVRVYALDHPAVLHSAVDLADRISREGDRRLGDRLAVQLELLMQTYARTGPLPQDLARVRDGIDRVQRRLRLPVQAKGSAGAC